jgi:hypothetical protein
VSSLWRNYNLSIVLAALFLVSWALQTWMGWLDFTARQEALGQSAEWLGPSGYIWTWGEATFENWQSEFLQLLTFVVLTAYLIHKGSHESKDGDERIQQRLDRIERRLDGLYESRLTSSLHGRLNGNGRTNGQGEERVQPVDAHRAA